MWDFTWHVTRSSMWKYEMRDTRKNVEMCAFTWNHVKRDRLGHSRRCGNVVIQYPAKKYEIRDTKYEIWCENEAPPAMWGLHVKSRKTWQAVINRRMCKYEIMETMWEFGNIRWSLLSFSTSTSSVQSFYLLSWFDVEIRRLTWNHVPHTDKFSKALRLPLRLLSEPGQWETAEIKCPRIY